ncbi:MAG TPA: uroporphyrinogen decarboxylase family protein [Dehalococcoidia bacterium]|nr:uroporphyrinogen decarboxylase family protein [Dehalococcoidia bacterium]
MDKGRRVLAALSGLTVDRVPVSAWGHDFRREWSPEGLAEATLEAYGRYDWDFIKVNPRATYYAEAWGARYEPSPDGDQGPRLVAPGLRDESDLARITPLDPRQGPFGEQLEALRLIGRRLNGEAPFVQTVFAPLAVLSRMAGGPGPVKDLMGRAPEALERALGAIAVTLADYARACIEAGASGIFYATVEWGSRDLISPQEYARFGRPYDLRVLAAVADAPFNVLHVCRSRNLLLWLLDYPVACFHWAAHEPSNPTLEEVQARVGLAVSGGVAHDGALANGDAEGVMAEALQAIRRSRGRRFLLAPGCSVPPSAPAECLRALRRAAEVGA